MPTGSHWNYQILAESGFIKVFPLKPAHMYLLQAISSMSTYITLVVFVEHSQLEAFELSGGFTTPTRSSWTCQILAEAGFI